MSKNSVLYFPDQEMLIPSHIYDMIPDMARYVFPTYYATGKYMTIEYQKSSDLFYMHFIDEQGSRLWTIRFKKEKVVIK